MNAPNMLSRQGPRLLQIGIVLFVFSGLEGFVIHSLPSPSLGRSVHTLSAEQGIITLVLGLLWPRLNLNATASRIAFWTFISALLMYAFLHTPVGRMCKNSSKHPRFLALEALPGPSAPSYGSCSLANR